MNHTDKLREALEQIANFSDVEMGDGDGARKVALEALAATSAPAAPSEPVAYWIPESEQFCIATKGERPMARAWRPLYAFSQPSAKPAGAAAQERHIEDTQHWTPQPAAHAGLTDADLVKIAAPFDISESTDGDLFKFARAVLASTPAPVKSGQPNVEFELRWMLACRISGVALYTDDGELQDNSVHPFIDFKRDTPQQIREALLKRANTAPVMAVAPEAGVSPSFECIDEDYSERSYSFKVNGVEVGSSDYDRHGWQGLEDMKTMFNAIAELLATPPAAQGAPDEHGQLDPRTATEQARAMTRYCQSFNGQPWGGVDESVDRKNLAVAIDNLEETSAMLLNMAERVAAQGAPVMAEAPEAVESEAIAQLRHLCDDIVVTYEDEHGLALNMVADGKRLLFSNLISAVRGLIATQGAPVMAEAVAHAPYPGGLAEELHLVLTDPDSSLSDGARRALDFAIHSLRIGALAAATLKGQA